MRELGNSIAQFFAIIMVLITLAVSSAAVSQWFSSDVTTGQTDASFQSQPLLTADAR